jgi:hypothetical protein
MNAPNTDPSVGLELVSPDGVNLNATRHLFLAANLMDPARQRDLDLPDGGEDVGHICLRRTAGKIHRCEITPLEMWVDWMPLELFPQGMEHMALSLKGQVADSGGRIFPQLYGYPYHPAHAITDFTGLASGSRRGIVELENLLGVEYGVQTSQLQDLFFPADYAKPVEIRLVAEHIEKVAGSVADPDVKDTANFMLLSCTESRAYMEQYISASLTRLAERKSGDYVHRLTPKDRSFMAQLEMRAPVVNQLQDTVDRAVTASLPPELLEQMAQNNAVVAGLVPALSEAIGNAVREAIQAATAKPATTTKKAD